MATSAWAQNKQRSLARCWHRQSLGTTTKTQPSTGTRSCVERSPAPPLLTGKMTFEGKATEILFFFFDFAHLLCRC